MSTAAYIHGTTPEEQQRLGRLNDLTNDAFMQFLEFHPTDHVLDVGCGLGILSHRVAHLVPQGEVWGVDASPEQLAQVPKGRPHLHFRQADAKALPFAAEHFDVAFCRYLLEHVEDPAGVLHEMHRVLKPGGKLFVQENNILACTFDPDCDGFAHVWQSFVTLQSQLGGDALIGKKLLRLLQEAGFREVRLSVQPEVHYQGSPHFVSWIENLIANVEPCQKQLVERGLASDTEVQEGLAELRSLLGCPHGSAFFYWNRARAIK